MAQEILYNELFLEEALVVEEDGKSALDIFLETLKGKILSESSLRLFKPFINQKSAEWTDIVHIGDELRVLPQIAGGV